MNPSRPFSIRPAPAAEKPLVAALFQAYFKELSRFPAAEPFARDESGAYVYPYFDRYWQEGVRFPYLLLEGDGVAGFALVRHNGTSREIAEFYVKPEFRRRGLGRACATLLVARHPGAWHIAFNRANRAGRALWTSLADDLSGGRYERRPVDACYECVEFSTTGNDIEDVS